MNWGQTYDIEPNNPAGAVKKPVVSPDETVMLPPFNFREVPLMYNRRKVLGLVPILFLSRPAVGLAAKPEDVFKGRIILTKERLPTHFASPGAFIAAVRKAQIDRVWPKEEKSADETTWLVEYIAFFAKPLNDNEVNLKFWEVGAGSQRFVAGDEQYTRDKNTRVFAANIRLGKPEFEENKKYLMTLESGRRVIASTTFWLRGQGPQLQRQGRVQRRRGQEEVADDAPGPAESN